MKKIIYYNPAISSMNKGDEIIEESCKKYLAEVVDKNSFIVEICTHLPLLNYYLRWIGEPDISFVLGSNLLGGKMDRIVKQWFLLPHNTKQLKNIVLMGVGWRVYNEKPNFYTKRLYKKLFSNGFVHSVRDEYTKSILNSIGITNVINTGCPTMWSLTKEHCARIPCKKSDAVIFTLTDYSKNKERDISLINTLRHNYKKIYFWVQGVKDESYLKTLSPNCEDITIIPPKLDSFSRVLKSVDCDYVGTRLHAGIKAMQCGRRSIIIAIDNRALELERDYNIVCIHADEMDKLDLKIKSEFSTDIRINEDNIKTWLAQFNKL